jgi:hypothetical protein
MTSTMTPGAALVGYLSADYATLVSKLGEPDPANISDTDKVDIEWIVPIDGDSVSIYSYHDVQPDHRHAGATLTTEWHVAASHPAALEAVSHMVFGAAGYTITREERWPGDSTGRRTAWPRLLED